MWMLLGPLLLIFWSSVDSVSTAFTGPSLEGSPASMIRQNYVARQHRLAFARAPADIAWFVDRGWLVPVPGNGDYWLKGVRYPFAHPSVRLFVERLAREYRRVCGEPLAVTSLVRPLVEQPANAHPLSVHPAGMAVDLRIPERPECQRYLEEALLALESEGVLDVTREKRPPHLHVAIFPVAFDAYLARLDGGSDRGDGGRAAEDVPAGGSGWWFVVGGAAFVAFSGALVFRLVRRVRRRRDREGGGAVPGPGTDAPSDAN